jgi:hypothetical protein
LDRSDPDAPFTFVTDGVEAAIALALEIAGDRDVTVTGAPSLVRPWTWDVSTVAHAGHRPLQPV